MIAISRVGFPFPTTNTNADTIKDTITDTMTDTMTDPPSDGPRDRNGPGDQRSAR